ALLLVRPLHELYAFDPSHDGGRVAYDAGLQLVPFAVFPEVWPLVGRNGQGSRTLVLPLDVGGDLIGALGGSVVAVVEPADAFAVDAHEIAAFVVVDHGLKRLAVLSAAQEQAAVEAEVVLHFEDDLEVFVFFVGDDDTAVARLVLGAGDGAVGDDPFAAGVVIALAAVSGFGADVPAVEALAVEYGDVAVVFFLLTGAVGRKHEGSGDQDGEGGE